MQKLQQPDKHQAYTHVPGLKNKMIIKKERPRVKGRASGFLGPDVSSPKWSKTRQGERKKKQHCQCLLFVWMPDKEMDLERQADWADI